MRGGGSRAPEGVGPLLPARQAAVPGERDQPPARGQQGEGRAHVEQVGAAPPPVHARGGGERRVHEHDRGPDVGQAVPDGLGVVAGHRRLGEQPVQKSRPHGGELVQVQRPRGPGPERALGKDGQHPGAGGGLQHHVPRAHPRGLEHRVGEWERGGELLAGDLLLRAPGVGRLQRGEGFEHREHPLGGPGLAAHGAAPALQEQHERGPRPPRRHLSRPKHPGRRSRRRHGSGPRARWERRGPAPPPGAAGGPRRRRAGRGALRGRPRNQGRWTEGERARPAGARAHPPPDRRRAWRCLQEGAEGTGRRGPDGGGRHDLPRRPGTVLTDGRRRPGAQSR